MKRAFVIGALIVVAVLATIFWSRRANDAAAPDANAGAGAGADLRSTEHGAVASSSGHSSPAEGARSNTGLQPAPAGAGKRVGAEEAKRLRSAILAAIQRPHPSAEPAAQEHRDAATGAPPAAVPTLDRKYIRSAINDIVPLIRECFELGRHARPELRQARAIVHFSIIGDAQLGGVVEESKLDDSSEGMTPELSECVRETMYGLQLPAPEGQGRVEVTYPFLMSTDPPDGDRERPAQ